MKRQIPGHKQEGHGERRSRNQRLTASDGKSCIATPADPQIQPRHNDFRNSIVPATPKPAEPVRSAMQSGEILAFS
jgi:hypothetical protein